MSYPQQSNFNSAGADDAWFKYVEGSSTYICKTNGRAFVRGMQNFLRSAIPEPTITFDHSRISGGQIVVDGKWGALTAKGLWTFLSRLSGQGIPQSVLDGLANEARLRRVGPISIVAAIAATALGIDPSRQFSDLRIQGALTPSGPIAPVWNTEPPGTASGETLCTVESVSEPEPAPPVPAHEPAPQAPLPEPQPTHEEVTAGVISPTPPGVVGPPVVIGSGVPLGAIGLVAVAVAFMVALGFMAKGNARNSMTPAPSRARGSRSARGQRGRR